MDLKIDLKNIKFEDIKEKIKNPDVNSNAAPWRWNAFNRHPAIIIIDEVIPIVLFRLFILLI